MQRLILNDARNPETKPIVRAGLARAYCELEECKRKLKMKPLPKPIDVTKLMSHAREMKQASILIDDEPEKESLSPDPTVTAPPATTGE